MPDVKFAAADVSAMKLGTTNVSKVMLGTVEVWPGAVCTDVLTEPFNNFTTNGWTLVGSTALIVAGRTGTAAAISGSSSNYATWTIPALNESDTITVGFAYRHTDASLGVRDLLQLLSDAGATQHNRLYYQGSVTRLIFGRAAAEIAANGTITLAQNVWYYIEVQCFLHDSAGWVKVRVDGVEKINATGLDTRNAGTKTTYDRVRIINNLTGGTNVGQWDDLYVSTGAGCAFKGDPNPPLYGAEQRVTINGTPNDTSFSGTIGVSVQFARAGRITKVRYYHVSGTGGGFPVNIHLWTTAGAIIAGPISNMGSIGYNTVTLPAPVTVTAGQTVVSSISAGSIPLYAGVMAGATNTADCTVINYSLYSNTTNTYPNLGPGGSSVYVEPIYEPLL